MTDKKSNDSRRKLLKSIAAGSGAVVAGKTLPDAWTKPIVDSVMLPAHAETTEETPTCCDGYVCDVKFNDAPIGGSAELNDCMITFSGDAIGKRNWGGSGAIAANGTFSFTIVFTDIFAKASIKPDELSGTDEPFENETISGTVSADCLSISGSLTGWSSFTGDIVTSESQCRDIDID